MCDCDVVNCAQYHDRTEHQTCVVHRGRCYRRDWREEREDRNEDKIGAGEAVDDGAEWLANPPRAPGQTTLAHWPIHLWTDHVVRYGAGDAAV